MSSASMKTVRLRFASWNVNYRKLTPRHVTILRNLRPDIAALQEVSTSFHGALETENLFNWDASSLRLRPPGNNEGRSRRLGCSIFGTKRSQLLDCSLLPRVTFRERALIATIEVDGLGLTVCSFHTPPGTNWGEVKPRTLKAIARWLPLQPAPLIFGIDANCPKTDHPDISRNEWWWDDEPLLLGASPLHDLKDVFRTQLQKNPAELARAIAARPNGPLAVSHLRGKGRVVKKCRYDFIYATPDARVERAEYLFDRKIQAVSD